MHETHDPHNQQSLYYQMWFSAKYQRCPTWADAIAHCLPWVQDLWKKHLMELNAWSEPPEGVPIHGIATTEHGLVDMKHEVTVVRMTTVETKESIGEAIEALEAHDCATAED
jgi:hypothetical protein